MAKPPSRIKLTPFPITSFSGFDSYVDVHSVLNQLEQGQFRQASILWDSLLRDDRCQAVLRTRLDALETVPLNVLPASKKRKARKIAEMLGGVDDLPGEWDRIFPGPTIAALNGWGQGVGIGVAEQNWYAEDGVWWPRLKLWHPQFLRWDQSTTSYKVICTEGEIELPRIDENPRGDGKWVVWCPYGYQYAWLQGMVRALAIVALGRGWNRRDWSRHCEVHGNPIRKAIVPGDGGKTEEKEAFFADVQNWMGEATVMVPQGADGNKYDVALLEATARTWETFQASKKEADDDIAILALGQSMTTQEDGGLGQGKDRGERVRRDKLRKDAGIAAVLRDQVLTWWARANFGDPELAPRPVYDVEPPEDDNAIATASKMTGDAIASLKTALGSSFDERAMAEDRGVPLRSQEEADALDAQRKEEAADEAAARAALSGAAGADEPDSGTTAPRADKMALRASLIGGVVKRYTFAGLPVAIENPAGTMRHWRDMGATGAVVGSTKMHLDYGFIEGVLGSDKEELDVYIGPNPEPRDVYVIHQLAAPDFKRHDEDKTMLGFSGADEARAAYVAHRNDGDRAIGGMSVIPIDRFKATLRRRTGTGKIRASAADRTRTTAALVSLVAKARGKLALKAAPDEYPDRLAANATRLAARALAPDVAAIRGIMDDLADHPDPFEALKKRLVAYSRKADPARVADVVARTRILAQLAGHLDVHKEAG